MATPTPRKSAAPAAATPTTHTATGTSDDNTLGLVMHLLALLTGFLGPLILWLIKKDQSSFLDSHGRSALNFQFTLLIGYVIAFILTFLLIGILVFIALWVVNIVFCILAMMKANKGEMYTYPMSIKFLK